MSNYTKATNFGAKDSLTTGDPNKVVKGSEFDTEFDAIETMSATKEDKASKNVASGYCPLDASVLVPLANIPSTLTGKSADQLDGYDATAFPRKAEAATITAAWTFSSLVTFSAGMTVSGATTFNSIPAFNGGTSGASAPFTVDSTFKVTNLNADQVDGYNAGNSSGQIPVSNGTVCTNLNADKLDGYNAGNSPGNIPISNGTENDDLYAETAFRMTGYNIDTNRPWSIGLTTASVATGTWGNQLYALPAAGVSVKSMAIAGNTGAGNDTRWAALVVDENANQWVGGASATPPTTVSVPATGYIRIYYLQWTGVTDNVGLQLTGLVSKSDL